MLLPVLAACRAFSLAQLVLQAAVGWRCAADLPFCFLLQTVVLVAFNKVRWQGMEVQSGASCLNQ